MAMRPGLAAAVGLVVGIVLGVGGTLLVQTRTTTAPVVQAAPRPDACPAVAALQTLQSIVNAGTTYQNYSAKVGEANAEVDRYLREAPVTPLRQSVDLTMRYHIAAATAWSSKMSEGGEDISRLAPKLGDDPRLSECPAIKSIREDKKIRSYIIRALNIVPFWQCTATQFAEAEKLLAEKK
jgi:hypothetical protein